MNVNKDWLEGNGLGKAIRKKRKAKQLTQEQLAKLVGVTRATISQYETGEMKPSANMFYELDRVLDGLFEVYVSEMHDSHGISDVLVSLLNELKIEWAYADIPDKGFSGIATLNNEKPDVLISQNQLTDLHKKIFSYFEFEFQKLLKEIRTQSEDQQS